MFICGAWIIVQEGPIIGHNPNIRAEYVRRCTLEEGHKDKRHYDSVTAMYFDGPTPVEKAAIKHLSNKLHELLLGFTLTKEQANILMKEIQLVTEPIDKQYLKLEKLSEEHT